MRVFLFMFVLLGCYSFQIYPNTTPDPVDDGERIVSLFSDDFSYLVDDIYAQVSVSIAEDQQMIAKDVLKNAIRGYTYLKHTKQLSNPQYLSIIDFSKSCMEKRFWVIDMYSRSVVFNELVAHGEKTGDYYAKYFSNKHSSHKSSLGFFTTGGTYYGSNSFSLKLNGLEKKYNSNAFARGIVIHGAKYVGNYLVERDERIGRSFGCPAVSVPIHKELINTIKGGSCLFHYHPTEDYINNSTIMNANVYMTVDELNSL